MMIEAGRSKICRVGSNRQVAQGEHRSWSLQDLCGQRSFEFWDQSWFYSVLHLFGWGPPTLCRAIWFTPSPLTQILTSSKKHLPRNIQKKCLTKYLGTRTQTDWHVKLIIIGRYVISVWIFCQTTWNWQFAARVVGCQPAFLTKHSFY